MKLATFKTKDGKTTFGVLTEQGLVDLNAALPEIPDNALDFIRKNELYMPMVEEAIAKTKKFYQENQVTLLAPLPNPESFRDFYGFNEHVENGRRNRGATVPPEYYEIAAFYFSNAKHMVASGEPVSAPKGSKCLDFEFEVGYIIGKEGKDIPREKALDHIFGYTILNDWSARDIQRHETKVGLGPHKGKDFATSQGPYIVTRDEWDEFRVPGPAASLKYNRKTRLTVNGRVIRVNNLSAIYHDFAAQIARGSQDVTLYPGELCGSGTIGGGCINELTVEVVPYLTAGDRLEMYIEGIGTLISVVK